MNSTTKSPLKPAISVDSNIIPDNYFVHRTISIDVYYRTYFSRLISHCNRVTRDTEISTTIVNDILLKTGAGKDMGRGKAYVYDPTKSHLSYLLTSAWRKSVNQMRRVAHRDFIYENQMGNGFNDDPTGSSGNSALDYYQHQFSDNYIGTAEQIEQNCDKEYNMTRTNMMLAIGKWALANANDEVLNDAIRSCIEEGSEEYSDIQARYSHHVKTVGAIKTRVSRFRKKLNTRVEEYKLYSEVMAGALLSGRFSAFTYLGDNTAYLSKEGKMVDGAMSGFVIEYYPSGEVKSKVKYAGGIPMGKARYFHPCGALQSTQTYGDNGYITTIVNYNTSGIKIEELQYEGQGVLVYVCEYDNNGVVYKEELM